MKDFGFQGPTNGETAKSYWDFMSIAQHPAFRLGFLDARAGRALDHDKIFARMIAETPQRAWERMSMSPPVEGDMAACEIAQYRYEEGRLLWLIEKPKVKAWSHPDFPPKAISDYCWKRSEPDRIARAARAQEEIAATPSIVDLMRGHAPQRAAETLPLFAEVRE